MTIFFVEYRSPRPKLPRKNPTSLINFNYFIITRVNELLYPYAVTPALFLLNLTHVTHSFKLILIYCTKNPNKEL